MSGILWKILIVEDDEEDFFLISTALSKAQQGKMALEWAPSLNAAREALNLNRYDVVMTDYDLGGESGLDLIREASVQGSSTPFILLTGRGSIDIDLEAIRAGASLYLTKQEANPLLLERAIRYAIERKQMEVSLYKLNEKLFQANQELTQKLIESQETERQQSFLTQLDLRLIHSNSADEIIDEVTRSLANFIELSGCHFWELDVNVETGYQTREASERAGRTPYSVCLKDYLTQDMLAALAKGLSVEVQDISDDPRMGEFVERYQELGIGAFITVPYLREGRWSAALTVHTQSPRQWNSKDVYFLRAVLARTWPRVEHTRMFDELMESEAFSGKILRSALSGLYIYNLKLGRITFINEQYTEFTGYAGEFLSTLEEDDFTNLFHPDDRPKLEEHIQELLQAGDGQVLEFNYRFLTADGRWIWCRSRDTVFSREPGGHVKEIIGSFLDITPYKVAAENLQENEAILESFYENTDLLMGVVELDGEEVKILHANRATARFLGVGNKKIEGSMLADLATIRDFDRLWFENFQRCQKLASPVRFEYYRPSTTIPRWISVAVGYLGEGSGGKPRFSFIVEDISQRKEAENLTQVLSKINEVILSSLDFNEIMNQVVCEAAKALESESAAISLRTPNGWRLSYVYGMPEHVIGTEMSDEQEPHAMQAIETRNPVIIEDAFNDERVNSEQIRKWNIRSVMVVPFIGEKHRSGVVFFNHHRQTHTFKEQQVKFATELSAKITLALENARLFESMQAELAERTRAEKILRQSEARFRELANAMPQLVWTSSPDGRVEYYNQRIRDYGELQAYSDGNGVGFPFLHPDDRIKTANAWGEAQQRNEIYQVEHRLRVADGSFRWHLSKGQPLTDEKGQIVKWYGTSTDIHYQKEVEEALKRSNKDLEAFAFSASHDLQEPLRKIESFATIIMASTSLDESERDYLDRMQNAARRMREMIDGLLSLARVTTGGKPFEEVDLNTVLKTVLDDMEASLQTFGGQVEVGELPVLRADAIQMYGLLQNLISNALKFTRQGVPPRVRVYSKQVEGGKMELYVEDNGIGFDIPEAGQLFQPFKRLHSRFKYPGSGMGLAICRKIMERHGGSITVQSTPEVGSTFILHLPAERLCDPS